MSVLRKTTFIRMAAAVTVLARHPERALFPGDIGKDIRRHFRLAGGILRILFHTTLPDGTPLTRPLTWPRMR